MFSRDYQSRFWFRLHKGMFAGFKGHHGSTNVYISRDLLALCCSGTAIWLLGVIKAKIRVGTIVKASKELEFKGCV